MMIRKCHKGEMQNIINVANRCFLPHRYNDFTFVNSVPSIYDNCHHDYSDIHFVIEEDNQMVAIGANLINEITLNSQNYKFSRVGTIGTIVEYRNRGYMREVMHAIDKDNLENNVIFSLLEGDRDRYKIYGYEKACLFANYSFFKNQLKFLKKDYNVKVREFEFNDFDAIYSLYLDKQKLILRTREDFLLYLNHGYNKLYTILCDDNIVGYFA